MSMTASDTEILKMLAARLERLSADCTWAHRGSGVRGQLLRVLDQLEGGEQRTEFDLEQLYKTAFRILEDAAREIG